MATRPAPAKKAPAKKAAAKQPAPAAAKSKAPAPKPKTAVPVVTLRTVFEQLGEAHELPKKQAHALQADFVAAVTTHLKQGDRIRMSGLGILEVKAREARIGRNPATGESMQIKASKKVAVPAGQGTQGSGLGATVRNCDHFGAWLSPPCTVGLPAEERVMGIIEAYWQFRCPECGFGDGEHGHLLTAHEIYCLVCLEEHDREVRLHRWERVEGEEPIP